tara:strand:+ start:423 stop:773 length:351 start_codon:yes stop_codon:yes gene_type:complete
MRVARSPLPLPAGTAAPQIFMNKRDNPSLDRANFHPFARVVNEEGFAALADKVYRPPRVVPQMQIEQQDNAYLSEHHPLMAYFREARVVEHVSEEGGEGGEAEGENGEGRSRREEL